MRITGGSARGHSLATPKSGETNIRPTSDRTREALFNILGNRLCDGLVLDLFAGTGSLGIEALSRGARQAVFIDRSRTALTLIHKNISRCFSKPAAALYQMNLARTGALRSLQRKLPADILFHFIFIDPPYEKKLAEKTLQMVEKAGILHKEGQVIIEERKTVQLPENYGRLQLTDQRQYGETGLWFYSSLP